MAIDKTRLLEQLKRVKGPDLTDNIVDLGLVSEIVVADSKVFFSITVPAERAEELEPLREAAEKAALGVEGVDKASVVLTAAKQAGSANPPVRPAPKQASQAGSVPPPMAARGRAGRPGAAEQAGRYPRHQRHRRGRVRQGRCRQVDHLGQSRACAARNSD